MIRSVSFMIYGGGAWAKTPAPLPLSKFTVLIGLNGSGKTLTLRALHGITDGAVEATCLEENEEAIPKPPYDGGKLTEMIKVVGERGWAATYTYGPYAHKLNSRCGEFASTDYGSLLVDDEYVHRVAVEEDAIVGLGGRIYDLANGGAIAPGLKGLSPSFRGWYPRAVLHYITAQYMYGKKKPKLLLWDDFGNSMHPALVQHAVRWLAGLDAQVAVSTHSIDVLYELVMGNYDFSVLRLRWDDEAVTAEQLSADEVDRYFEGGIDPRKVFGGAGEG